MKYLISLLLIFTITVAFADDKDRKIDKPEESFVEKAKVIEKYEIKDDQRSDEILRKKDLFSDDFTLLLKWKFFICFLLWFFLVSKI